MLSVTYRALYRVVDYIRNYLLCVKWDVKTLLTDHFCLMPGHMNEIKSHIAYQIKVSYCVLLYLQL